MITQKFFKNDIGSYVQDFKNVKNKRNISADVFTTLLKKEFPDYKVETITTIGWGNTEYPLVETVSHNKKIIMRNHYFVVIKEPSYSEEGILIGIKDLNNYQASIDKLDSSLEYNR